MNENGIFLTAEWRKLILINYAVEKDILLEYLPAFTELDDWQGKYYVSLVGFMFLNTRLRGYRIPFHGDFEEINLRFYVKYNDAGTWKRGVVFIKEIVPKPAITFVANTLYQENYQTLRMKHLWDVQQEKQTISYSWKNRGWHNIAVSAHSEKQAIRAQSKEEFITEHYWGYTKLRNNLTSEYGVAHPKWEVYPVNDYRIAVDFRINYGEDFGFLNQKEPDSVMLAEGSEIEVKKGRKLSS